eukprot:TRINITY_DN1238_c0_g3_i1.p1 TRINITY_DN1238_c0_g3~~TRINITY_DN1238_c0_g3_i1.p1  ORF type:complete len:335 (-),score=80.45 TRINITY_DN1238_c0_g3_i1:125-1129(-)
MCIRDRYQRRVREKLKKMPKKRKADDESEESGPKDVDTTVTHIKNKIKRNLVYQKLKKQKKTVRMKERKKRKKEREKNPNAPPPAPAKTLENTREADPTMDNQDDPEVEMETLADEFASHFNNEQTVKNIVITTSLRPSAKVSRFAAELSCLFPGSQFIRRKEFVMKDIIQFSINRGYSHLLVLNETKKQMHGLILMSLPYGPTAHFRLTGYAYAKEVNKRAQPLKVYRDYNPELIVNNFQTQMGVRLGRMLASTFPPLPHFKGKRVITFHNQRDFIFFRHHSYIIHSPTDVELTGIGPRFCLKLRSLQTGLMSGEYEWIFKKELETSRRKFFL